MAAIQNNQPIIGSYQSGEFTLRFDMNSIPGLFERIDQILVDDLDRIWISEDNGNIYVNAGTGFQLVQTSNQLRVFKMKKGPNNTVYMLRGGQFFIFQDPQNFAQFSQDNSQLPADIFVNLEVDKDGTAWLLPSPSGTDIVQFRQNHQVVSYKFYEVNLAEHRINGMTIDPSGELWIATSNGIKKWEGYSFSRYCKYNTGLSLLNFSNIAIGTDGRVWSVGRSLESSQRKLLMAEPGT
jgi:ligand-binding sensor domain-containing protein